jgi:hypothetical protein
METKRTKRQNYRRFVTALFMAFVLLMITGEKSSATIPTPPSFSADIGTTGGFDHYDPDTGIYKIIAGGADIWGTTDQCHYLYLQASGDFDAKVYVLGIFAGNVWAKLGWMARQDLTTTAVNVLACATLGGGNGRAFQWRPEPGGQSNSIPGSEPPTRQPQWIRLKRVGNTFTGYSSIDGQNWQEIGRVTINMTDPVYIGIAATSHDVDFPLYALFTDLEIQGDNVNTPEFPEEHWVIRRWNDVEGTTINDILNNDRFPTNPDTIMTWPTSDFPQNQGDNYAQWATGTFTPEISGDYNFWISSDDSSQLWLSTDNDPANTALIAQVPDWTNPFELNKYLDQQSSPFTLGAGQSYYIDALMKEGGGGDHLAVAFSGPDDQSPTVLPITLGNSLPLVANIYPPPGSEITPSMNNVTIYPDTGTISVNTFVSFNAPNPFNGDISVTSDPRAFGPSAIDNDGTFQLDWRIALEDQPFTAGHNEVVIPMEPGPQTIEFKSDDGRSFKLRLDIANELPVIEAAGMDDIQTTGGVRSPDNGLIEYIFNREASGTATIGFPEIGVVPAGARPQIEIGRNPANEGGLTAQLDGTIDAEENPGGYMFDTSNQGIGVLNELPDETKNFYITVTFDTIEGGNIYSKRVLLITTQSDGQGDHFECGANNQNTFLGKRENGKTEEFIPIYDDFIGEVPVKMEFNMNIENGTYSCTVTDDEYDFVIASYSGEIPFLAGINKLFVGAFLSGDGSAASTTFSNIRITADSRDIVNGTNLDDLEPAIWGWNIPSDATLNAKNENGDIIGSVGFNTAGDDTTVTVPFAKGYSPANLDSLDISVQKPETDTTTQGTIKINKISLVWDPRVSASLQAETPDPDAVPGFLIRTIQAVNGAGWGYTGMKRLLKYGFVGTTAPKPKDFPVPIRAQVEGTRISQSVNLSDSGGLGYFSSDNGYPDETYPGVDPFESPAGDPGSGDDDDNFATEVLACIYLTAGDHIIGANSDDGTIIRVGGVKIGQTDEFKGASNVDFTFEVDEDGWYDFRAQSLEGTGGAAFELHEVLSDDTRILLGDVDQGGSEVMVPSAWIPPEPPKPVEWTDDFEDGNSNLGTIKWTTSGDAPWITSSNQAQSGLRSAQSGDIGNNEETVLETTLDCGDGEVSFYRRVSSERSFDYLIFAIDGVEQARWSGEEDWQKVSFAISAGRHTFTFSYVKDSSTDSGSDRAWIDNFNAPAAAI